MSKGKKPLSQKELLQLYFRATVKMAGIIGKLAAPGTTTEERDALGSYALGICFDLPPIKKRTAGLIVKQD